MIFKPPSTFVAIRNRVLLYFPVFSSGLGRGIGATSSCFGKIIPTRPSLSRNDVFEREVLALLLGFFRIRGCEFLMSLRRACNASVEVDSSAVG